MIRQFGGILLVTACLALVGCTGAAGRSEPERFPVQGTVTLDGKPLAKGLIYFKTIATGAIDGIEIKDGKFEGKAQDGERRVEICAYETVPPKGNGPMDAPTQKNTIPSKYNVDSQLTKKVERQGPNQFAFELLSR